MSLDLKSLNAVVSALNQLYSVAEQSGRTVTASSLGYPFMGSSYGGTPTFSFAKVDSSGVLYVNATSVGNPNINIAQVLGAVPSSSNPLAVELTDGAAYYDSRQIRALTSADVVTANQGGTWNIGTVTTVTTVSTVTAVTTVSTVTAVTTVGTVTTLSQFPSTAALADTTSNPTLTEIACFNMGFNGTTWDRLRSDTNKYLYVDVANSTLAVTQSGAWTVAATQSGSWTVAATQSGTWNIGIVTTVTSITNPVAVTQSGTWTVARSWTLSSATDSVSAVQSGTWNIGTVTTVTTVSTVTAVTTVGTITTLSQFPSTAALADATANPTLTQIQVFLMLYNGATWDRLRTATNASTGTLAMAEQSMTTVVANDGSVSVSTVAQLPSLTFYRGFIAKADNANTGIIYLGKSTATNVGAHAYIPLASGEAVVLPYNNSNLLYAVASTGTQLLWIIGA